jgi:hypothetical protein
MKRVLVAVVLTSLSCSLSEFLEPEVHVVVVRPVEQPVIPDHWTSVSEDAGVASVLPTALGRRTRRQSVDQLRNSFPVLFGDTWRLPFTVALPDGGTGTIPLPDGGEVSIFPLELIAPVLGEADFITENRESLDVTPSFLKFMDNAAANLCVNRVFKDLSEPNEARRRFVKFRAPAGAPRAEREAAMRRTLRWVRLTFHAVYVAETDTASIADLETLHADMIRKAPYPNQAELVAWSSVCVQVVTDPAFTLY